jgi:hypothetical protein
MAYRCVMSAKQILREIVDRMPESAEWKDFFNELKPFTTGMTSSEEFTMDEMSDDDWALTVATGLDPDLSADPDYVQS